MDLLQTLKSLVNERLSAAAEEILGTVGRIVTEYEDEAFSLKQEIAHKSRLLDMVLNPYIKLHRADILNLPLCKEEVVYPEQQNMNSSLVQEEPQIKEEQEELLLRPDEGLTLLTVKREDDGENRETEPVATTTTEHMKTQTDVEECAPHPTSDSHRSESDTEDSDEWEETKQYQPANMEGQRMSLSKKLIQDLKSPKHMNRHTEKNAFNCRDCGKMFSSKNNLKSHTMIHTGEYPFNCTICGKGCSQISLLKRHMMTHTGENPFTCTICGKGCRQNGDLKKHMMIHTGEKPFTCTVCGKGCRQNADLKTHMRIHTGEKPFSCTVCGRGCVTASNLKKHIRTHTGEKLFSCVLCGKSFTEMGSLKKHMRTHTGEPPLV